jgi:hypothetical protein
MRTAIIVTHDAQGTAKLVASGPFGTVHAKFMTMTAGPGERVDLWTQDLHFHHYGVTLPAAAEAPAPAPKKKK